MKKQMWILFSVVAIALSVGSMQAQAQIDGIHETRAEKQQRLKEEKEARETARPARVLRQVVDEYTSGRLAGLSDGSELTTSELCETAPSMGATIRLGAVKAISENGASSSLRTYKQGYERGFADGREYTSFNARKDSEFCKN
jgi:hypothetical protein